MTSTSVVEPNNAPDRPVTLSSASASGRRLRVAQVCADRGIAPGSTKGAAQHLRGIAGGLVELGHEVVTYTERPPEGPFPTRVEALAQLAQVSSRAFDVVYERYALGHLSGLHLARRRGVPFVLEVNAPLVAEARAHRPQTVGLQDQQIEERLLVDADLVVAVSTDLGAWVDSIRSGPTIVLPNGFEPTWFPVAHETAPAKYPLVFLGHPKPWHGADRIVDLLVALSNRGLEPDALIIGGGPGAETLRERADRSVVGDRLHITGALPPQAASLLLQDAGIGLAPYPPIEPFYFCPLKIVDYLAAGLPVVATDQGDIAELVGDAGLVVAPDDDEALIDAVATLLSNDELRKAMGRAGRERASKTMTWAAVASRTADAIFSTVDIAPSRRNRA